MAIGQRIWTALRHLRARALRRQEDAHLRDLADYLAEVPLFGPLSRGMRFELAEALHERRFERDEYLFLQGDPGIGAYIIQEGSVRRLVRGDDGASFESGTAGPGEIVGLDALVGAGTIARSETVQATSDTVALGLFAPELRTVERRHPRTGAAVMGLMARHLALCLDEIRRDLGRRESAADAASLIDAARERAAEHSSDASEPTPA